MINTNTTQLDREDAAVLFAAMVQVVEHHGEDLDRSLVAVGYGEGLARCIAAAGFVAQFHTPKGGDWDGCVWFERLEEHDPESLAYLLFNLDISEEDDDRDEWFAAIRETVVVWLGSRGEQVLLSDDSAPNLSSAGNLLLGGSDE